MGSLGANWPIIVELVLVAFLTVMIKATSIGNWRHFEINSKSEGVEYEEWELLYRLASTKVCFNWLRGLLDYSLNHWYHYRAKGLLQSATDCSITGTPSFKSSIVTPNLSFSALHVISRAACQNNSLLMSNKSKPPFNFSLSNYLRENSNIKPIRN